MSVTAIGNPRMVPYSQPRITRMARILNRHPSANPPTFVQFVLFVVNNQVRLARNRVTETAGADCGNRRTPRGSDAAMTACGS